MFVLLEVVFVFFNAIKRGNEAETHQERSSLSAMECRRAV